MCRKKMCTAEFPWNEEKKEKGCRELYHIFFAGLLANFKSPLLGAWDPTMRIYLPNHSELFEYLLNLLIKVYNRIEEKLAMVESIK